jgi:hypothetical protein
MRKRIWSDNQLILAVETSSSIRQIIIKLGLRPTGGNYKQVHDYINELNLSTTHLVGKAWNKGLRYHIGPKQKLEDLLVVGSKVQSYKLKLRLFRAKLKMERCEHCGWKETSEDGRLPLELDHINGNHLDNRLENLRILCPNCHSLTPTYRRRGKIRRY